MNDDELSERVSRTLRAKAEQVRVDDEPIDPALSVASLDEARSTRRSGWPIAVAAAIAVLVAVAAGAIVLRNRPETTPAAPPDATSAPATASTAMTPTTGGERSPLALEGWTDSPDAGPSGEVSVDRFNTLLDTQQPTWQDTPIDVAVVFSHLAVDATERGQLTTSESRESSTRERVQVTLTGLADDSVGAERYDVVVVHGDRGWSVQSAQWSQRCQPNRGHQDFNTELCV